MVQVQQVEKTSSRSKEKVPEPPARFPEQVGESQQVGNQLAELLSRAENAYQQYRQAQQEVALGYKKHERQMEELFKDAEKRANEAYEKLLARAITTRERAKQEAEEAFRVAQAKADEAFQRTAQDAMRDRREVLQSAWQKYVEGREHAWGVFQGERRTDKETD